MKVEKLQGLAGDILCALMGSYDENARVFERELGVSLSIVAGVLHLSGEAEAVEVAARAVPILCRMASKGQTLLPRHVRQVIDLARLGREEDALLDYPQVAVTAKGKPVRCRTAGQCAYMRLVDRNELVFCIGPAGTGKTYLAVARAVSAYRNKEVERIILTRPAVEAGERLGFLPGDLQQKVDPYLRPLYDALQDLLGVEAYQRMLERGAIEVAPLAYMRGRTLNAAYIILDEAQNTTAEQMKMFLTRMGEGSRVIVTGDTTQIDLPRGVRSGLLVALDVLSTVEGIGVCRLSERDVVRHDLVGRIVRAYEQYQTAPTVPTPEENDDSVE